VGIGVPFQIKEAKVGPGYDVPHIPRKLMDGVEPLRIIFLQVQGILKTKYFLLSQEIFIL
jgi:hypothetical protein